MFVSPGKKGKNGVWYPEISDNAIINNRNFYITTLPWFPYLSWSILDDVPDHQSEISSSAIPALFCDALTTLSIRTTSYHAYVSIHPLVFHPIA